MGYVDWKTLVPDLRAGLEEAEILAGGSSPIIYSDPAGVVWVAGDAYAASSILGVALSDNGGKPCVDYFTEF
jgi:hypothetical protein